MNVIISRDELQKRLADIQSVVDKKTTMPILGHFLLSAGEKPFVSATDLETAIKEPVILQEVKEGGELCIPARKLYEIVREVEGDIKIESEGVEWLKLKAGKSNFRLACMSPEDFPKWPGLADKVDVEIEAGKLLDMIEKTLYSAGESDSRYTLNSLLFHIKPREKTFTVVGTDGHRLSAINDTIEVEAEDEIKVIVPRKSASELRKFLPSQEGRIRMEIATNHVAFIIGEVQFLVRLIEGTYPNYEQVIPVGNEKILGIAREEFIKSLRRVSVISRDHSNAVKIDVSPGTLTITASNPDIGEAKDEVQIDYEGEGVSLGFNARYLLDALNALTAEKVIFEVQEPLSTTLLREEGNEKYKCVIMPMRI
ncbi:DNA polymerase III subunit beta [bacterium BMS3Bbin07]|nr:DNA polymerase III subunit beta [bacterium BMS3Bbin07]HDH01842.1 DNA polymerase III subunit beta [Nitrospirota bacterium]